MTETTQTAEREGHLAKADGAVLRADDLIAGYLPGVNILNGADPHEVGQLQRGFAKECLRAFPLEHQELALYGANRCGSDVAIGALDFGSDGRNMRQQAAQILEIEQQQIVVVGVLERDRDDAFLRLVELEQARKKLGSHLGHGRADRMAALAVDVP